MQYEIVFPKRTGQELADLAAAAGAAGWDAVLGCGRCGTPSTG